MVVAAEQQRKGLKIAATDAYLMHNSLCVQFIHYVFIMRFV